MPLRTTTQVGHAVANSRDPKKLTRNAAIAMKANVCLKGILMVSLDMIRMGDGIAY